MAKAIVTGGAGFIGHHLVDLLLREGHKVEVWDDLSTGKVERIPFTKVSFRNINLITDRLPDIEVDWVFHLASPVSVQESIENPDKYEKGICVATSRLVSWASRKKVSNFVFASTAAVYGDREDVPFVEDSKLNPISPYAQYKLIAEHMLSAFSDLNINVFRFFNVFGEDQPNTGSYAPAVALFLKQHLANEPITITGDGAQTRDYVYVKDVCSAMYKSTQLGKSSYSVMNLGFGQETSIIDIAKVISGNLIYIPARKEPRRSCADITAAKKQLEWSPITSILQWVQKQK